MRFRLGKAISLNLSPFIDHSKLKNSVYLHLVYFSFSEEHLEPSLLPSHDPSFFVLKHAVRTLSHDHFGRPNL